MVAISSGKLAKRNHMRTSWIYRMADSNDAHEEAITGQCDSQDKREDKFMKELKGVKTKETDKVKWLRY